MVDEDINMKFWYIKNKEDQYLADYSTPQNLFWTDKERAMELLEEQEANATALEFGLKEGEYKLSEED